MLPVKTARVKCLSPASTLISIHLIPVPTALPRPFPSPAPSPPSNHMGMGVLASQKMCRRFFEMFCWSVEVVVKEMRCGFGVPPLPPPPVQWRPTR